MMESYMGDTRVHRDAENGIGLAVVLAHLAVDHQKTLHAEGVSVAQTDILVQQFHRSLVIAVLDKMTRQDLKDILASENKDATDP
jgi:hypothetical protein